MAVAALTKQANLVAEPLARSKNDRITTRTKQRQASSNECVQSLSLDQFLAEVEQKAYRIAYYSIRDEQLALDLVQDAMLKLVEKYASNPSTEWPALFFTILSNRIIDARRWNRLREGGGKLVSLFRPRFGQQGEEHDLLDYAASLCDTRQDSEPESRAFGKELRVIIDAALVELSERQRQVFLLREWQGFNVQQTATILGCSEGSIKQHHFRAMRNLRKQLATVWADE